MFKVIVERPRSGSRVRWSTGTRRLLASETMPAKVGMLRGHGKGKWSKDHLGPLRRFLFRRVGRPWDAVMSEICAVIDARSTVQQHVLLHVSNFVTIETTMVNGEVCGPGYPLLHTPVRDLPDPLYVHPETGLLCRNDEYLQHRQKQRREAARRQAELEARRRIVSPTEQLHCIDGTWYFVTLAPLPGGRAVERFVNGERRESFVYERRWDVLLNAHVSANDSWAGYELYDRRGVYAASKRQLGKRELRRYGLK
jgi:hypothetical protein